MTFHVLTTWNPVYIRLYLQETCMDKGGYILPGPRGEIGGDWWLDFCGRCWDTKKREKKGKKKRQKKIQTSTRAIMDNKRRGNMGYRLKHAMFRKYEIIGMSYTTWVINFWRAVTKWRPRSTPDIYHFHMYLLVKHRWCFRTICSRREVEGEENL